MSKLDGIKAGDRVRVTFEGVVTSDVDAALSVKMDGSKDYQARSWWANLHEVNAPTFQITRIEPALVVGEMVTWGRAVDYWEIVAIKGDDAIVYNKLRAHIMPLSDLRRA